jgi:ribosomal protein S18 acetylase RimI-like enzyme
VTWAASETDRAREWVHSAHAAVCDVIEPWEHGTVVRATRHPTYWDYNLVRVEDDAEISADELVRIADTGLAGLSHRRAGFEFASRGEVIQADLERLGWKSTRLVWMLYTGLEDGETGLDVEQVHYDTVRHLRLAWHEEDFPSVDVGGHLDERRQVDMQRDPEVLAAFEKGRPVGFAQLERAGGSAEVSSVFVDREHRGRGLGTALTKAVIAAAREVDDLWIVADDDDRPKDLYARLGFRPVWKLLDFLRLPRG